MEIEGTSTAGETMDGATEAGGGRAGPPGRPVRVSYEPRGFGVALVVDDDAGTEDDETAGLLHVGDAVVTLEIPLPGGGRSVLTWDPSEVTVDPLVA